MDSSSASPSARAGVMWTVTALYKIHHTRMDASNMGIVDESSSTRRGSCIDLNLCVNSSPNLLLLDGGPLVRPDERVHPRATASSL